MQILASFSGLSLPLLLVSVGACASGVPHGAAGQRTPDPPTPSSAVDRLTWLAGCWETAGDTRTSFEMWSKPAGGLMVGAGRSLVDGTARGWEHLRLHAEGEGLVYVAIPSGQSETAFRSTTVGSDGFAVENLDHDFPQRLVYTRVGTDAISVRVESADGSEGFDIAFARVGCRGEG